MRTVLYLSPFGSDTLGDFEGALTGEDMEQFLIQVTGKLKRVILVGQAPIEPVDFLGLRKIWQQVLSRRPKQGMF